MQQKQKIPVQAVKWQYTMVLVEAENKQAILDTLTKYGEQYWELVSIIPTRIHQIEHPALKISDAHSDISVTWLELYFKRPLP